MRGTAASPPLRSDRLRTWRDAGEWLELAGRRVFVRSEGRADPVLLLIHGFPTASWDWHALWPALAARYRVLAPDLPGFGFSDKPPHRSYRVPDYADALEALLVQRGVGDVHVLAHDLGDTVAQELLARHAETRLKFRLRSVVLLNGGLFPETHRPRLVQTLLAGPLGGLLVHALNERAFGRSLAAVFGAHTQPDAQALAEFWDLVVQDRGHRLAHKLLGYMAERRRNRERWVGALAGSKVPLRLIAGLEDPISGAHMVARYRELIPAADVIGLAGIGHYPQVEAPAAVLAACEAFWNRVT